MAALFSTHHFDCFAQPSRATLPPPSLTLSVHPTSVTHFAFELPPLLAAAITCKANMPSLTTMLLLALALATR